MADRRKGWVAALLAIVALGTGHFYAGVGRRGLILALLPFAGIAVLASLPSGIPGVTAMLLLVLGMSVVWIWSAYDAYRQARALPNGVPLPGYSRWYVVATAVLLSWYASDTAQTMIREGRRQAFRIPSGAMSPTLEVGDYLMVNMTSRARIPTRGMVAVFRSVEDDLLVVKRIVAIAGDTIAMQAGQLYRNDVPVEEPYLAPAQALGSAPDDMKPLMRDWQLPFFIGHDTAGYAPDLNDWGPLVVATGHVMVLGDNREHSYDGRYFGFVPDSLLLGSPLFVYLSRDSAGTVRWNRIGKDIR